MLAFAMAVLLQPQRLSLDEMTVPYAQSIAGQKVTVTFFVAKPSYTIRNVTVIGADDQLDGVERGGYCRAGGSTWTWASG